MYQRAIDLISEQYYSIGKHMTELVSCEIERGRSYGELSLCDHRSASHAVSVGL